MEKRISAYKARVNFGELLNEVYYKNNEIIIERKGRPMVKIIRFNSEKKGKDLKKIFKLAGTLDKKVADRMLKIIREARESSQRQINFMK